MVDEVATHMPGIHHRHEDDGLLLEHNMYFVDYFYLSILLILAGLAILIRFIFAKHYGKLLATKVVAGVFGISLLIAFISFKVISRDINEQAFPATNWQQYMEIQSPIKKLEYRPGLGLYAI
ncbi:MAG: hypothetical protein ABI986_14255, partial [Chloroflexota bacterium]